MGEKTKRNNWEEKVKGTIGRIDEKQHPVVMLSLQHHHRFGLNHDTSYLIAAEESSCLLLSKIFFKEKKSHQRFNQLQDFMEYSGLCGPTFPRVQTCPWLAWHTRPDRCVGSKPLTVFSVKIYKYTQIHKYTKYTQIHKIHINMHTRQACEQ